MYYWFMYQFPEEDAHDLVEILEEQMSLPSGLEKLRDYLVKNLEHAQDLRDNALGT